MDPGKVLVLLNWPSPESWKQLQRFLGFANVFIWNYSTVAAPLTALISIKRQFKWSPKAATAFRVLKERFTSAPILQIPDPALQFMVEVDASNIGVGAFLSQRATKDPKLHPCTYFSSCLSPAERNNDIGNRKLLAVKLPLEE